MKRTSFRRAALLVCVALTAGMTLASCEKENNGGTIRLNAEKLSGDGKTYVDGVNMGWVNGDLIKFNATTCTVSNGAATGIPQDVDLIAFYPNDISEATAPANSATVTVPSVYTYSYSDGHQILALPMVGTASSGDESITMQHLCSAMQITITNGFDEGLELDSILLIGSGLSGSTTVDLSGRDPVPGTGDNNSVALNFTNCTIAVDGNLTVQIPVLPTSGTTWVRVRGHLATSGTLYLYRRSTRIALGRAKVHAAPITMSTTDIHTEVAIPEGALPGVFTINSDGDQVYFSKGNLWYNNSNGGSWKFADNQYDYIGTWNTDDEVDLFSWGRWAGINPEPLNTNGTSTWDNNDFQGTIAGAPGPWRTLTQAEWDYLLNDRTTTTGVRYAFAAVEHIYGLVILPDDWSSEYWDFSNDDINHDDWTSNLEPHGAVFLPAAGYRDDDTSVEDDGASGDYWSSTANGTGGACSIYFDSGNVILADNFDRYLGRSVRLVRDL